MGADLGDKLGVRLGGVAVVEAGDIGEQYAGIRVGQVAHQGGETVVVAEGGGGGRDGVVLVDDRDDAELSQSVDGPLGVSRAVAARCIGDSEEDLADGPAVAGETACPLLGQQDLSRGRGGLLGGEVGGSLAQAERSHAAGDGAGGDDDDVGPAVHAGFQGVGNEVDTFGAHTPCLVGETGGADLHDDTLGVTDRPSRGRPVPVLGIVEREVGIRELLRRRRNDRSWLMDVICPEHRVREERVGRVRLHVGVRHAPRLYR